MAVAGTAVFTNRISISRVPNTFMAISLAVVAGRAIRMLIAGNIICAFPDIVSTHVTGRIIAKITGAVGETSGPAGAINKIRQTIRKKLVVGGFFLEELGAENAEIDAGG